MSTCGNRVSGSGQAGRSGRALRQYRIASRPSDSATPFFGSDSLDLEAVQKTLLAVTLCDTIITMTGLIEKGRQVNTKKLALLLALFWLALPPKTGLLLTATSQEMVTAESAPVNGLKMSIAHPAASENPFRLPLTFRNLTARKMTLLLGGGCSTVGQSKTNAVEVSLTAPDGRAYRKLQTFPAAGGCGGGLWVFTVTLRPSGSKSFPLDLRKYFTLPGFRASGVTILPTGTYTVRAKLETRASPYAVPRVPNLWTGTITSNGLPVKIDKAFAIWQF